MQSPDNQSLLFTENNKSKVVNEDSQKTSGYSFIRQPLHSSLDFRYFFIKKVGIGFGLFVPLSICIRFLISRQNPLPMLVNFGFSLIFLVSGLRVRRDSKMEFYGILHILCIFGIGITSGLGNGGMMAPTTIAFILMPFFGYLAAGKQGGILSLFLSGLGICFLVYAEKMGWVNSIRDPDKYLYYKSWIYFTGGIILFYGGRTYENARIEAESSVIASEQELRGIIDATPACVKVVDSEGTILSMNQVGLDMLEIRSLNELNKKSVFSYISSEYRQQFVNMNERICRGQEKENLEFEINSHSGKKLYVSSQSVPLRQKDGSFVQLAVTHDISERKRNEKEIMLNHSVLNSMMDSSPVGVLFVNHLRGELLHANSLVFELLDIDKNQFQKMQGNESYALLTEKLKTQILDANMFQKYWNIFLVDSNPTRLDDEIDFLGGKTYRILTNQITEKTGTDLGRLYVIEDITYRKKQERHSHNYTKIMTEIAQDRPLGQILKGILQDLTEFRSDIQCALMLKKEDQNSLYLADSLNLPSIFKKDFQSVLMSEESAPCGVTAVNRKRAVFENIQGNPLWTHSAGIQSLGEFQACWTEPIMNGLELLGTLDIYSIDRFHLTEFDLLAVEKATQLITIAVQRDRTGKALELQRGQALAASKMAALGEMASGIAHEINNPLAIINGRISIMKETLKKGIVIDPSKWEVELEKVSKTTLRIAKIIKGLKTFARDSQSDPFLKTSIQGLIENADEICREKFLRLGVDLKIQCLTNKQLECRESQIVQILVNLLSNSLDAAVDLPEKWVRLEAIEKNERIQFRVTDSGDGIAKEIVEKIMHPFFTTKVVGKGTGLGLSISRGIAQDHQGSLEYDALAENTSFVLDLPLVQTVSKETGMAS